MNPDHTFIQGGFFDHMAFVTNMFTAVFVVLGLVLWFFARKSRNSGVSWLQLVYSVGLIGFGILLIQHQVRHYIGACFVFLTSIVGLWSSTRSLFIDSKNNSSQNR